MAKRARSIAQLRNLPQYKGMTDEELEKVRHTIAHGNVKERIEKIIVSFEKDYDLIDMAANDLLSLQELAGVFVLLEDVEVKLRAELKKEHTDWLTLEKMNRVANQLRDDASKLQRDLGITRKGRQDSGSQSVVVFIEDLKKRAKHFLAERLFEVYCPKCKMLLSKAWFLYPGGNNRMRLQCGKCHHKFSVISQDLLANRNKNMDAGPPL